MNRKNIIKSLLALISAVPVSKLLAEDAVIRDGEKTPVSYLTYYMVELIGIKIGRFIGFYLRDDDVHLFK